MLTSDWTVNAALPLMPEIVMVASDVHERVEHFLDGLHHAGIRAIRGLQDEEVRHFRVDADGGGIVESLLQGIDNQALPVTEILGCFRGAALLAHDLPQERRQRSRE